MRWITIAPLLLVALSQQPLPDAASVKKQLQETAKQRFLTQGVGTLQPGTGIVTGSIQMVGGGSAAGVRVGAVPADDPTGSDLLSVTETDGAGRYRLVNIPAGRYFIVAGRLDNLTYYPGGTDRTKATEILIEPARVASGINFTVPAESRRPVTPATSFSATSPELNAYRRITTEQTAGAKLKLLLEFEKNFPRSVRLAELYMDLSRACAKQTDLPKAIQYAEKAVATTERMKNEPPPATCASAGASWQNWVAYLDAGARNNLTWVKQMIAWQRKELESAILRRR
jgi:hypothetical protein